MLAEHAHADCRIGDLILPDTPPFATEGHLKANLKKGASVYTYENFTGRVGGSDLGGSLVFDTLAVNGHGDRGAHELDLAATGKPLALKLALSGSAKDNGDWNGTLRTLDAKVRQQTIEHVHRLAGGVEEITGTQIAVSFDASIPSVLNDAAANGFAACAAEGPWDAILVSGSVAEVPEQLLALLARGGRLVTIVGQEPVMRATVVTRVDDAGYSTQQPWDTIAPRLRNFPEPSRFSF